MIIDISIIKTISDDHIILQQRLYDKTIILYTNFINSMYSKYKDILKHINEYISNIDFVICHDFNGIFSDKLLSKS